MESKTDSSVKNYDICGLCRFSLKEEHLVQSHYVKAEILKAFDEQRAFAFFADQDLVDGIRTYNGAGRYDDRLIEIKNRILEELSQDDEQIKSRFAEDTRLSDRLYNAVYLIHKALASADFSTLNGRRFVIIKELAGKATLYHVSNETTVISHVGQGPYWAETPTLYLGLKIFDIIGAEKRRGEDLLFDAFLKLLKVEERAIETGFIHTQTYSADYSLAINSLVNGVIDYTAQIELRAVEPAKTPKVKPFGEKNRDRLLHLLNARDYYNQENFDYDQCIKAIDGLARLARRYKKAGDRGSLFETVRLLVTASGHDIHEVRNRANIILERVFAPKEYEAPLATTFYNLQKGDSFTFNFELPFESKGYLIRIYTYRSDHDIFVEDDIEQNEYDLVYDEKSQTYSLTLTFSEYGHYDYTVLRKKRKNLEWLTEYGTSGRVNVMGDVRGDIILQIFTDIHGHTKLYWHDETGHPGLVYNENGDVIRTGRFADVAFHLEDMKRRYSISAIYLLGCQQRGDHHEDWAEGATSPSPFSPMSLIDIDGNLGGEEEFKVLVDTAHELDIKIIVDIIPHINRHSDHLSDDHVVYCYGGDGNLYPRSATDGRYGSWDDGKLLNYRQFEIWQWLFTSIETLVTRFDIDGIRFDSAHAVPIMMKKNNFPFVYDRKRSDEEMVEGRIIVNERWDEHFVTTGYYDCQCRDSIAVPLHQYLMYGIERIVRKYNKSSFYFLAECYWGHERFLARSGIIPYNSSLFKVCENISHGKSDVREIYHIYDNYYPAVLPSGTELLGIFGNHDERRALNTFGQHGLKAAISLTSFMSDVIMDYEGNAEGEGWKVFLDNIYVNWNQFEYAAHRSVNRFYKGIYAFHAENKGRGVLAWANNTMVAAALKEGPRGIWIGAFNFANSNQSASIQFDNPALPIDQNAFYKVIDPLYSKITDTYSYYTGKELSVSRINTVVSYVERVKFLRLESLAEDEIDYPAFLRDSFYRMCSISTYEKFESNFAFLEIVKHAETSERFAAYLDEHLFPLFYEESLDLLKLGLKRAIFYMYKLNFYGAEKVLTLLDELSKIRQGRISEMAIDIKTEHSKGPIVFMSAEADPFSKSGGLANVVFELPREMVKNGEEVYVITGYYRNGDPKAVRKMTENAKRFNVTYTGRNVRFKIMDTEYVVGVHKAEVYGVTYFLLDHHELFDGLYWGVTSEEKMRRRIGFARACAEVICNFMIHPFFTFTNDAFAGLFNGIVRSDGSYGGNSFFRNNTYLHIVHNGGWQYFDAYERHEKEFDLFSLFNLEGWKADNFTDPVHHERLNCMAAGIRFADKTITVSPSYARQIEYQCDGLEHILNNVMGVSNGVGFDLKERLFGKFKKSGFIERNFEPMLAAIRADAGLLKKIEKRYPEIIEGTKAVDKIRDDIRREIVSRKMYKMMLQVERGLDVDPDRVVLTMIHRITEQKGYQLLLDTSEGLFNSLGCQAILGGPVSSGDKQGENIAHGLWLLGQYYPKSVSVEIGFQDLAIPLFCTDLFLMPSMNEPGGIAQLEAFTCGALVVARATGGLRDTVFPLRLGDGVVDGNGFLFSDFTPWSFYDAIERAVSFFASSDDETVWRVRNNAEDSVFFWDIAAKNYIQNIYDMKEIIRVIG